MRALNKAIELRPRYAEPLRYRATLHQYQGDLSSAVTDLRRARDLEGDRRTSLRLARLLAQRGEFVRAEDIYKSMLRGNPDDRDALDGLTNLYMQQSNWLSLERLIKQRKEMHPDSTAPYLAEARMWAQRGNDGRRVRALSRAVQVARTPATFAAYLRGLVQTGRHQQTLDALEGDVPQGLEQLTPLIRAAALAGTGKTSEADNMFRRILQRGSTAMAMQVVPMAVAGYGSEDGAKKLFRWIDLRPRDGHYIHQVARLMQSLQEEGALRRAAQLHRQVVDLAADGSMLQGQAFTGLGVAEYHLGNYKEARDAYLKALAIRRNDIQALNNLAYLFVDGLNQPADGLKYAKRAIEVQPRNPNVLDTYGWALAHTGRLTEARKALERAVRLSRTPVTLHHLGWVYEKADNLTDALRTYRDAVLLIEEGAGDPELKSTLNQAIARVQKKRADERS
jgi:tetratricopeptide (TPR) repeat protein